MNISLQDRNAVVCGSSGGIGLAVAMELAALGCNCFLLARDETDLKIAVNMLPRNASQQHRYYVADFFEPEQVKEAVREIVSGHSIHILVNNSGGPKGGPVTGAAPEDFEEAFRQHVVCNQILSRAVLPGMQQSGYGRIINIISSSVKIPIPGLGVSNTIRGAVAAWAKTLSYETGQYGITVNNVLPGSTSTRRLENIIKDISQKNGVEFEAAKKSMMEAIPLRRFGLPEEIAGVVAFLASPAASYVNGASIPVDGGRTGSI